LLNIKRIARRLANPDGAEIAEAALVLPLVAMLLFGIIWFGRAFNIYSTIQQAAQQGAITAARPVCATCTQANSWGGTSFPSDGTVTGPNGTVTAAVGTVMKASNLDPTQILASPSPPATQFCSSVENVPSGCSITGQITTCRNAWLNSAFPTQPPQCGTAVSFQFPFKFNFPGTPLNMQQIKLSAQAQSRMEN
jgi:hypothetical protein